MYDSGLKKKLNNGKLQSKNFFSQTDYVSARNAVHTRIFGYKDNKTKPLWSFPLKIGFVVTSLLVIFGISLAIVLGSQGIYTGTAYAQEKVSLSDSKDCLISYFPINSPNSTQSSLMSVLWEQSNSRALYSTMFENCNKTFPASIIAFPDTGRNLVLIFSGDRAGSFIDYRLLGYSKDAVKVWRSQDFVPNSKLEVKDGVIVEQRSLELSPGLYGIAVTYIVPYDIQITGELILSVKHLQLRVGEQILLVGSDAVMLNVSSESGLVEKVEQLYTDSDQGKALGYRATGAGSDVLLLNANNTGAGNLIIDIEDQ